MTLILVVPSSPTAAPSSRTADRVEAALDGADENITALKVGVDGPGTVKGGLAANLVVLGVDVEIGHLLKTGARIILVDGGDVDDARTRAVVCLPRQAVDNILVVVDGALGAFVHAPEYGVGQILNVDNVGGGMLVGSRAGLVLLVELVVQQQVAVILGDPALVGVGGTVVGGARQLARHGAARDVDDGQGVLVEVEADLPALVSLLGAAVDDALGVVDVAVGGHAAGVLGPAGVGHVDHPQAGAALEVVLGAHGGDEVRGLVGHQVVAAAEPGKVRREVPAHAPRGRVAGVRRQELGEVKDLQAVVRRLGADVGKVLDDLDVAPRRGHRLRGQAPDVGQAAVLVHLGKGGAVALAQEGKLAAAGRVSPA